MYWDVCKLTRWVDRKTDRWIERQPDIKPNRLLFINNIIDSINDYFVHNLIAVDPSAEIARKKFEVTFNLKFSLVRCSSWSLAIWLSYQVTGFILSENTKGK